MPEKIVHSWSNERDLVADLGLEDEVASFPGTVTEYHALFKDAHGERVQFPLTLIADHRIISVLAPTEMPRWQRGSDTEIHADGPPPRARTGHLMEVPNIGP